MTKASPYQWRLLVGLVQAVSLAELRAPLTGLATGLMGQLSVRRIPPSGGWLIVTVGVTAMLYWNGRLVLATGAGVAVMTLIYLMHDWKLEPALSEVRKRLIGWNQPFVLAAAGGGVATLTTYWAASVWAASDSPWIASGAILQGAGTLAVLILLTWQILNQQAHRDRIQFNQALADLTHDDPLKRLIAVRQLTTAVPSLHNNAMQQSAIADYFRLMLNREQEPIVREAVLDGLQLLDRVQALPPATQPAINSAVMKRLSAKSRQRVPVR